MYCCTSQRMISRNHSKVTWNDVWRCFFLLISTGMQFYILKTINSLCQYCHLTLKNRRCIHNRWWSLSTGHFLQSNSIMPQLWIKMGWERERDGLTHIHSLCFFFFKKPFTQCLWFFEKSLSDVLRSSFSIHFLYLYPSGFFSKNVFFFPWIRIEVWL